MNEAEELIRIVESRGGRVFIEGEKLVIEPQSAALPLIDSLRAYKPEIIDLIQGRTATPPETPQAASEAVNGDSPDEWAADFVTWIDANCVHRPGKDDWTAVSILHIAFCESQIARDSVPCTRAVFEDLLRELGCQFRNGMVSGFLLRVDWEAALQ
jgi:hypothetical protein